MYVGLFVRDVQYMVAEVERKHHKYVCNVTNLLFAYTTCVTYYTPRGRMACECWRGPRCRHSTSRRYLRSLPAQIEVPTPMSTHCALSYDYIHFTVKIHAANSQTRALPSQEQATSRFHTYRCVQLCCCRRRLHNKQKSEHFPVGEKEEEKEERRKKSITQTQIGCGGVAARQFIRAVFDLEFSICMSGII